MHTSVPPSVAIHHPLTLHQRRIAPLTFAGGVVYLFLAVAGMRVWMMVPERWPEILTAVVVIATGLWQMFRSLGKMVDAVQQNKQTTEEFRAEFKDAMKEARDNDRMQAVLVEGLEQRMAHVEAHMAAHGLFRPVRRSASPQSVDPEEEEAVQKTGGGY